MLGEVSVVLQQQLAGLLVERGLGKGSMSRQRTMTSTWRSPISGAQSRLSTFTQISPALDTFGWKILVRK